MIQITEHISIEDDELTIKAVRSSGPGGQHANKVATAIILQFDILSSSLPDEVKTSLFKMNDQRISDEGRITIKSQSSRSQSKNKQDAIDRLIRILQKATKVKKKRKKTKPSKASIEKRIETKKKRGEIKAARKKVKE